jgi:DNA-binding NarL/FixJ family response regulator
VRLENPIKLVLVDYHVVVREGVKTILATESDFQVVGEADDGAAAIEICREIRPFLVLMGLNLPRIHGIHATEQIVKHCPGTKVVILSMRDDENSVMGAVNAGASGFVLKQASFNEVLTALRAVAAGGSHWSPAISHRLVDGLRRGSHGCFGRNPADGLTDCEVQLLHLVAAGKSTGEIAAILNLEPSTVRSYRKTTMRKLGVHTAAGLIQIALTSEKIEGYRPIDPLPKDEPNPGA